MIFQHEFASHISFRLMNQHGVNDPIKLISMCPTMDLLAVCTETDSVWVARWFNSLEKIWTLPAEKHAEDKVEVLTWRPDGKVIALGYSSGAIRLYNVDKLEMIHELFPQSTGLKQTINSSSSAINFLIWVQENERDDENVNEQQINYLSTHPVQRHLPKLNTIPRAKPISNLLGNINESYENELEDDPSNLIDLLIAGDASGNLHLSVYGIYQLLPLSISSHIKSQSAKIIKASVTPDLSYIILFVRASYTSPVVKSNTSTSDKLVEVILNTGLLHARKNEIRTLSQTYTTTKYLTEYIFEGFKQIKAEYENMKSNAKTYIDKFQSVLLENDANSKLSAEFVHFLATGRPSSLLHKYLEMHLTKRGLKDWESKGQKSFEQIREYIHHYVRPGCERLLLRLSTLIGYCKWQQRFKGLGLSELDVRSIIVYTECLINRLENMLNVVDEKYIKFMEFQQWLQYVDHNQNQEAPPRIDISKVASYIKSSLHMDFLDEYFEGTTDNPLPDMLILRCNKMSTSTAYNVINSVETEEFLDIFDNLLEGSESTLLLLLDTRIITKENQTFVYVAFCLSGTKQYLPPSLWVLRSSLKSENSPDSLEKPDKRTSEIAFIKLQNQERQNEYLRITDMRLFDDEKMHIIVTGLNGTENEVSSIAEVNYSKLNFVQVVGPYIIQVIEKSNRVNVVDQILNQKNFENFNSLFVHQYREITQFKPSKLITNGARGLACILSEDKKRIIILDTNDQEDEDENNSEMMQFS
ncbi:anaphase-promoting complex subunit 4-like [Rhizophagus clarus]|uniref:Anaphase-promoting complex subunit 4 n=1 Tax=Rhizophagus clarus TaxID=94130 RepID=A0A8H3LI43_9GLOM|nr:anaphase-promoting complex subunit 4-like [Rhizophagus clarus]